jgi:hypothetical protein
MEYSKAYAIARDSSDCKEHGHCAPESKICRMGAFSLGEYPPIFTQEKDAFDWVATLPKHDQACLRVVVVRLANSKTQPRI